MNFQTIIRTSAALLLLCLAACNDSAPSATPVEVTRVAAEVGAIAPGFTAYDPDGRMVSLRDFRGKVVLIDFWATWCTPCIADLPNLKQRWARFRDEEFVILGVSLDDDLEAWRSFVRSEGIDWVNVAEGKMWDSEIALSYRVDAIPSTFLIDRDGRVVAIDKRGAALDAVIDSTLGK